MESKKFENKLLFDWIDNLEFRNKLSELVNKEKKQAINRNTSLSK